MADLAATDEALELHRRALVLDAHSDIPVDVVRRNENGETDVFGSLHLEGWRAGGLDGAVVTVGGDQLTEPSPLAYARRSIDVFVDDVAQRSAELAVVTSPAELETQVDAGRIAFALAIEGSRPFEGQAANIELLYAVGVRFVVLTWSSDNEVGTGAGTTLDEGLTPFGRDAVRLLAELGVVIDLSHASEATFWDTLELGTGNVVASHSNAAGLLSHPRNISDEQIRALAEQGGYIGVCPYPDFLQGAPPSIDDLVDQIAYVADLVGIEHVALGLDFLDYLPVEEAKARLAKSRTSPAEIIYPNYAVGLEGVSRVPRITEVMLARSFATADIEQVLGGSLLRVWKRLVEQA